MIILCPTWNVDNFHVHSLGRYVEERLFDSGIYKFVILFVNVDNILQRCDKISLHPPFNLE